jgi:hypothetical protein
VWPGSTRAGFPDAAGARALRRRARVGVEREGLAGCSSMAEPPAKVPTRSFGPCRSTRMPIGRPAPRPNGSRDQLAHALVRRMAHVDAEDVGAGLEQPAIMARSDEAGPQRGDDLGPAQPSHRRGLPGGAEALRRAVPVCGSRGAPAGVAAGTVGGLGQLHGPDRCSPVSTSKKPVRSKPRARQSSVRGW